MSNKTVFLDLVGDPIISGKNYIFSGDEMIADVQNDILILKCESAVYSHEPYEVQIKIEDYLNFDKLDLPDPWEDWE